MSNIYDETSRIQQLRELMVLDSAPEPVYDSIVKLASQVCGTPIALVSLVDTERQWFKANVGLPGVNETPRDVAFCAHAIADDDLFEVPDATLDARFRSNPLVTGQPDIRFYAGAPLVLPDGARVGTLCVIDRQARQLDAAQRDLLRALARIATEALLARRDLIARAAAVRSEFEQALADSEKRYRAMVEGQAELVSLSQPDGTLVFVNAAYARQFGHTPQQMVGRSLFDFIEARDRAVVAAQIAEVMANGQAQSNENRMLAPDGSEHWVAWTNGVQRGGKEEMLLYSVGRDVTERRQAELALRASQAALARTGRIAGVGGWQLDLLTSQLQWSEQTRLIHEVGSEFQPTLDNALDFYAPQARAQVQALVREAMDNGTPWDQEFPLVTARGRHIWVRAQGEIEFDGDTPVRLAGAFQDISERRQLLQDLADKERFVRQVTDGLPLRIAYLDPEMRFRFVNEAHCARFGRPREEILGRTVSELTGRADDPMVLARVQAALSGTAQHFEYDETGDDGVRRFESELIPDVADDARVRGFFSTGIDITVRQQARAQRARQEATLRSVIEAMPTGVAVLGRDALYRFVNKAYERWIGLPRDQIIGRKVVDVIGPSDFVSVRPWMARAFAGESVQFERSDESRNRASHVAVSFIPLWLDDGSVDGIVGVLQDISHHKLEEVRLMQLAQRDALTGLLNRAGFEEHMAKAVESGDRGTLALLYIDLDHFKPVNDAYGHPVGDQVLQMFAQRISALVRPTDAVARMGGDEFAVMLSGVPASINAQVVADKVIAAAQAPFSVDGHTLRIGASVGVAYGVPSESGWADLVSRADTMLYEAKNAGRGRQAGATD